MAHKDIEESRKYHRNRAAERRRQGLCGSCNNKALPGESRCQDCKDRYAKGSKCADCGKRRKAMYAWNGLAVCARCVVDRLVAEGTIQAVGTGAEDPANSGAAA